MSDFLICGSSIYRKLVLVTNKARAIYFINSVVEFVSLTIMMLMRPWACLSSTDEHFKCETSKKKNLYIKSGGLLTISKLKKQVQNTHFTTEDYKMERK